VVNLLTNAIKYTDDGAVTLRVTKVRAATTTPSCEKVALLFEVIDTGVGVPEESLQSIFKPFTQGPKVGTGLGLPICKALVELMGSTLLLKSPNSLSGGSTFSFTLVAGVPGSRVGPFQGTENGAAVPNGSGMVAPNGKVTDEAAIERPTAATLPSGLRVLIADDQRLNRKLLKRRLVCFLPKPIIVEAETGEEALTLLTESTFDIAFLDQYMEDGGLKGTDISLRIRQMKMLGSTGPILLIVCSGNAGIDGFDSLAHESGVDAVIGKPLPDGLRESISMLLLSHMCDQQPAT